MPDVLRFSVQLGSSLERKEIGVLGNTNWFLTLRTAADQTGKFLHIFRDKTTASVKIDTTLNCKCAVIRSSYGIPSQKENSVILANDQKEVTIKIHFYTPLSLYYELEGSISIIDNSEIKSNEGKSSSTDLKSAIVKNCCTSSKLSEDFLCLVNNPDSFADATLNCGTAKIPVHRSILSARSLVFAAIFKTQMEEGREGFVDMVDLEPDVLQAMLRYVYSGKTDNLTNSLAGDLLIADDKFQLGELKVMCVNELKASMAANNVFRALDLGDMHDKTLKVHAVEFICKCEHFSDLVKTEEWQSLLKERTSLAVEVLTTIVKHVQEKLSHCKCHGLAKC